MIAVIKKKTSQRVCWFNWENYVWGLSFLLFCILISMVKFYHFIVRESPKYQFLAYL